MGQSGKLRFSSLDSAKVFSFSSPSIPTSTGKKMALSAAWRSEQVFRKVLKYRGSWVLTEASAKDIIKHFPISGPSQWLLVSSPKRVISSQSVPPAHRGALATRFPRAGRGQRSVALEAGAYVFISAGAQVTGWGAGRSFRCRCTASQELDRPSQKSWCGKIFIPFAHHTESRATSAGGRPSSWPSGPVASRLSWCTGRDRCVCELFVSWRTCSSRGPGTWGCTPGHLKLLKPGVTVAGLGAGGYSACRPGSVPGHACSLISGGRGSSCFHPGAHTHAFRQHSLH